MIDAGQVSLKKAPAYTDGTQTVRAQQMQDTCRLVGPLGAERGRKGDYLVQDNPKSKPYLMPKLRFEDRYWMADQ